MRTTTWVVWSLVAGLAVLSTTAEAQRVDRTKWGMAGSLGGGKARLEAPDFTADEVGSALAGRFGYGFRPDMTIGFGISGWLGEIGSESWNIAIFGPELTWYPGARNFFLRFTVGAGFQSATVAEATVPGKDDSGAGAMAALGYELPIVRTVMATIHGEYGYLNAGSDTWSDMVNVQVGFAWYPGKPPTKEQP